MHEWLHEALLHAAFAAEQPSQRALLLCALCVKLCAMAGVLTDRNVLKMIWPAIDSISCFHWYK
jgi:hypothetical protein